MLLHFVVLFSLTCVVKSDNDRTVKWTKINNDTIEENIMEYCNNKNCLIKCCPLGQRLRSKRNSTDVQCEPFTTTTQQPNKLAQRLKDLSEFNKYSWNFSEIQTSKPYFDFIQNDFYTNDKNKTFTFFYCGFKILQDGSLSSNCSLIDELPALKFCVDFMLFETNRYNVDLQLACKVPIDPEDPDAIYIATGIMISVFFMLLVLLVYSVLPSLRNIAGMVLMAYLLSLIMSYSMTAALLILNGTYTLEQCENTSPALYYFILASFFWLNIMSFDLWWTIRGSCKRRTIHHQGERVKFLWYSLCAWGVPALITLLLVIIERKELIKSIKYKPPFSNCFAEAGPTRLYLHLPTGIMTIVSCIMFAMTALNIWKIKNTVAAESRNTKKNENRFLIYIKLSILSGCLWVDWVLGLLPRMSMIPHIIVNFFTISVGVGLFYVFVCKKSTIKMLCERFNISNTNVDRPRTSQ